MLLIAILLKVSPFPFLPDLVIKFLKPLNLSAAKMCIRDRNKPERIRHTQALWTQEATRQILYQSIKPKSVLSLC